MTTMVKTSTAVWYEIKINLNYGISLKEGLEEGDVSLIEIGYDRTTDYSSYRSTFSDIDLVTEIVKNLREENSRFTFKGKSYAIIDNTVSGNWWDLYEDLVFQVVKTSLKSETTISEMDI